MHMISIKRCSNANTDHKISRRQYAHTYHLVNVICIADEFVTLPFETQMGILAHEVGHLLIGKNNHEEKEADKVANKFFKINIQYKDSLYGNDLQFLSVNDMLKVYDWIEDNVDIPQNLVG